MIENVEDKTLINEIQEGINVDCNLQEIINRHSGIYLDMVNAFSSKDNPYINQDELISDKDYKIYQAILKYDETNGAKFSTYLGNETKWMCLNLYNKNKRRPVFHNDYLENMPEEEHQSIDFISESIKEDLFNKVLSIIETHPDNRVEEIFKMRYITCSFNKVTPWKNIGNKLNLSIQGCINIHNSALKDIRKELKEEINNE
jgi:DNA-directed RNA polymerase specialized sigma subunit